jgi:hypothetical protein
MELEAGAVLVLLLHKKLKKRKGSINSLLNSGQERDTAFNALRNDELHFLNYFCMSIVSFDELPQHIRNDISAIKSSV